MPYFLLENHFLSGSEPTENRSENRTQETATFRPLKRMRRKAKSIPEAKEKIKFPKGRPAEDQGENEDKFSPDPRDTPLKSEGMMAKAMHQAGELVTSSGQTL